MPCGLFGIATGVVFGRAIDETTTLPTT